MAEPYAFLLSAVIFAPFIEEFAKAFPLFYRHGETQRSIFTLGFLVGLGFGVVEFFIYVFVLNVPFEFRLPGIFFHAATTSIIAYGVATKRTLWFYLIAVFLHFSLNFAAFLNRTGSYGDLSFVLAYAIAASTFFLSWRLFLRTSEKTF